MGLGNLTEMKYISTLSFSLSIRKVPRKDLWQITKNLPYEPSEMCVCVCVCGRMYPNSRMFPRMCMENIVLMTKELCVRILSIGI